MGGRHVTTVRLPGLVDIHVHMRQPGGEHKETWDCGTAAALTGGITTVMAMPNTDPAVVDATSFEAALTAAADGARCDYAHYVGASLHNADAIAGLAARAAGLKLYLNETFGDLRLDDEKVWAHHLEAWPAGSVLAVHAEGATLASLLTLAGRIGRPVHICHVATEADMSLIVAAKERGRAVTCEVAPHHLFLDQENAPPGGRSQVRPRLGTPRDRKALWAHLDAIDCFATDHAPHTIAEKDGPDPPPGFPGTETMLPLLLTAVHEGLLDLDDVVTRLHRNPVLMFGLPVSDATWVEVDVDVAWKISAGASKAGWTPFEGRPVRGKVTKVVLRGTTVFDDDKVVAVPGWGCDVRRGGGR